MVMKGGITSGVVYPGAIATLAKTHRFRGVGGASAGAIAAGMAAAAEYGRSNGGESFDRLAALPDDLGKNMVARLQPTAELQPLWNFLLGEVDRSSKRKRNNDTATKRDQIGSALRALGLVIRSARLAATLMLVLGIALVVAVGLWQGGWAWAFVSLLVVVLWMFGLAALAKKFASKSLAQLNKNNFGFCDGHTPAPGMQDTVVLTDWLNDELGLLAGLASNEVLTFQHLWGEPATQAYRDVLADGRHNPPPASVIQQRDIDLTMMVTNVSQGRAHKFPFDQRIFFWCPTCLGGYLDDDVLEHMTTTSRPVDGDGEFDATCPRHSQVGLRTLPAAPDMPVVLGIRMSFSFPVMFSAVPLHIADWTRVKGKRGAQICWFADGGITSNFPMHFFDSLIPARPTFGISLSPVHPDHPDTMAYRASHKYGWQLGVMDIKSVGQSLGAMISAMQNWQDRTLQRLPGYRDRIVDVRLHESEGGLNLTMPAPVISGLSQRGEQAAALLETFEMDPHRWIRYRVAMNELADLLAMWEQQWTAQDVVGRPIQELMDADLDEYPYCVADGPNRSELDELKEMSEALAEWARKWEQLPTPGEKHAPRQRPQLRTTPRL